MKDSENRRGQLGRWLWVAPGAGGFSGGETQVMGRESPSEQERGPWALAWTTKADCRPRACGLGEIKVVFSRRKKNVFNSQPSYDLDAAVGRIAMSSLF